MSMITLAASSTSGVGILQSCRQDRVFPLYYKNPPRLLRSKNPKRLFGLILLPGPRPPKFQWQRKLRLYIFSYYQLYVMRGVSILQSLIRQFDIFPLPIEYLLLADQGFPYA